MNHLGANKIVFCIEFEKVRSQCRVVDIEFVSFVNGPHFLSYLLSGATVFVQVLEGLAVPVPGRAAVLLQRRRLLPRHPLHL